MFHCIGNVGIGKVIVSLVIVIILIQIWHMNMLIKQEQSSANVNVLMHSKSREDGMKIKEKLITQVDNAHVLDSSGTYQIITDIFSTGSPRSYVENDLTLVSQTSSNHIDEVISLSKRWDGAMSISVFTHAEDFETVVFNLLYVMFCFPKIQSHVNFHIIYPLSHSPSRDILLQLKQLVINCENPLQKSSQMNYNIKGLEYPHNLLRNTAVQFSKTRFVLVIDIDTVPNVDLWIDFRKFVTSPDYPRDNLTVFIVPSFEYVNNADIPKNRKELLHQWRLNKIRPFYYDVCWKCQKPTDYDKWKFLPEEDYLSVSYHIEWQDPWEPFYIVKKTFPLYDERFKQYGFNRISQVCEMNIAGYRFGVLNNAFLVHKGFKFADKFHETKEAENNRNRDLYRQFKKELEVRYPHSSRTC